MKFTLRKFCTWFDNSSLKTTLRNWINQYNHNRINGLASSHTKQTYLPEFKLEVVQAVKHGQFATRKATLYFGIPNSGFIRQWFQAFD